MDGSPRSAGDSGVPLGPAAVAGLRVVARWEGAELTVAVHGEADVATSDQLRTDLVAALDAETTSVVVDLSGLSFCDLAGSDALHGFVTAATSHGATVVLSGMSPLLAWLYREWPPRRCVPVGVPRADVRQRTSPSRVPPDDDRSG